MGVRPRVAARRARAEQLPLGPSSGRGGHGEEKDWRLAADGPRAGGCIWAEGGPRRAPV